MGEYNLYQVNNQEKSGILGLWQGEKKKIYRDKIHIKKYDTWEKLNHGINDLFNNGEKAVFYTFNRQGIIIDNKGNKNLLPHRLRLHRKKLSIQEIKRLLHTFNGITIFKYHNRYVIEVYHN